MSTGPRLHWRNPRRGSGARWYTVGCGRETVDSWGWVKLGPGTFTWGVLDEWRLEMAILGGRVWRLL